MIKHFFKRLINYLFRKKSLLSSLYLTIGFFLSQLASFGQSSEITNYCNRIQKNNPDNWKYDLAEIIKILYADGNTIALIVSGLLILILIGLVIKKNRELKSNVDFLKVYEDAKNSFVLEFDLNTWVSQNGHNEIIIKREIHKKENPVVQVMRKENGSFQKAGVGIDEKENEVIISSNQKFIGKVIIR